MRLNDHIAKIPEEYGLSGRWVWGWVRRNLSKAAAVITIQSHALEIVKLQDATDFESLFSNNTAAFAKFVPRSPLLAHEGVYLYYDSKRGMWIRSGKVNGPGRSYRKRLSEHKTNSSKWEQCARSKFYLSYPLDPKMIGSSMRYCNWRGDVHPRGCYGDLVACVGFGWKSEAPYPENVATLFDFSADDMMRLGRAKWPTETVSVRFRCTSMVAYLMELAYDLMLGSFDRVSSSPGFESPLGYHFAKAVAEAKEVVQA